MRSRKIYGALYSDIRYLKFISSHTIGIPGTKTKKEEGERVEIPAWFKWAKTQHYSR